MDLRQSWWVDGDGAGGLTNFQICEEEKVFFCKKVCGEELGEDRRGHLANPICGPTSKMQVLENVFERKYF